MQRNRWTVSSGMSGHNAAEYAPLIYQLTYFSINSYTEDQGNGDIRFNVDNRWENTGLKSRPRKARIDSTGALYHIVIRGIEGNAIMFDFVSLEAIDFHPRC